jgi:hypothetical protein
MPDSLPHGERMEQLSPSQALDRTLAVTFFRSHGAAEQFRRSISLRAMVPHLRDHRGPDKASLPWLKLALFGDVATIRGSLRHDANVTQIDGIEADYDGEDITPDRARRIVERANIAAVIYTSPSHTAERPRWRILCPTSEPLAPADRARLVARVNGLFCGALAGESFTLSQSYYFGALHGATAHEVIALDGRAIDLCYELDEDAIGRHPAKPAPAAPQPAPASRYDGAGLRFAVVALERECDAIRAAPEGQKHTALNKAAYSIGGLVGGGHLPEHEAYGALAGALADIRARCADYAHAERTLRRAFDDGKGAPRAAPEPLATTTPAASHHPFGIGDSSPAAYDAETGEIIAPVLFPATPFAASDLTALRPREWVYGHYLIARFLSVLGAPGGTGKTAYAMVVGLSIATNRPLLGETVHKAGPVWIYNLEDPRDEVLRRVQAACIEHSINPADLEGRLFLDSGRDRPLVVAERTREGTIIALPVVEPLIEELKARLCPDRRLPRRRQPRHHEREGRRAVRHRAGGAPVLRPRRQRQAQPGAAAEGCRLAATEVGRSAERRPGAGGQAVGAAQPVGRRRAPPAARDPPCARQGPAERRPLDEGQAVGRLGRQSHHRELRPDPDRRLRPAPRLGEGRPHPRRGVRQPPSEEQDRLQGQRGRVLKT